jgi:hypothetical protein
MCQRSSVGKLLFEDVFSFGLAFHLQPNKTFVFLNDEFELQEGAV